MDKLKIILSIIIIILLLALGTVSYLFISQTNKDNALIGSFNGQLSSGDAELKTANDKIADLYKKGDLIQYMFSASGTTSSEHGALIYMQTIQSKANAINDPVLNAKIQTIINEKDQIKQSNDAGEMMSYLMQSFTGK
jgi:hypothetical protein